MVKYKSDSLDRVFHALSDPTRRAILMQLGNRDRTVTELAEPHNMSLPAISKHLKVLEGAKFLKRTKQGRIHRCRLDGRPLKEAASVLEKLRVFWESQLDSLDQYFRTVEKKKTER